MRSWFHELTNLHHEKLADKLHHEYFFDYETNRWTSESFYTWESKKRWEWMKSNAAYFLQTSHIIRETWRRMIREWQISWEEVGHRLFVVEETEWDKRCSAVFIWFTIQRRLKTTANSMLTKRIASEDNWYTKIIGTHWTRTKSVEKFARIYKKK